MFDYLQDFQPILLSPLPKDVKSWKKQDKFISSQNQATGTLTQYIPLRGSLDLFQCFVSQYLWSSSLFPMAAG